MAKLTLYVSHCLMSIAAAATNGDDDHDGDDHDDGDTVIVDQDGMMRMVSLNWKVALKSLKRQYVHINAHKLICLFVLVFVCVLCWL